jgi:hypothetical protein
LICSVNSPSQNWGEPIKLVVERDLDKTKICKESRSEEAPKTRIKIRERLLELILIKESVYFLGRTIS